MIDPQLVIRKKKTVVWYVGICSFLLFLLLGSYFAGRYVAVSERNKLIDRIDKLRVGLDDCQTAYLKASERLVMQSQFSKVDSLSGQKLTETIKQLQNYRHQLESELKFYRNIMSPELERHGLTIDDFILAKSKEGKGIRFKLVLTQLGGQEKVLKGQASMRLHGSLNGSAKVYAFRELGALNAKDFRFRFRYFQNIEGEINIPEGFVAKHVIVEAKTRGLKKNQSVRKQIIWAI